MLAVMMTQFRWNFSQRYAVCRYKYTPPNVFLALPLSVSYIFVLFPSCMPGWQPRREKKKAPSSCSVQSAKRLCLHSNCSKLTVFCKCGCFSTVFAFLTVFAQAWSALGNCLRFRWVFSDAIIYAFLFYYYFDDITGFTVVKEFLEERFFFRGNVLEFYDSYFLYLVWLRNSFWVKFVATH